MSVYACSLCPYESQWDFAINNHWKQHHVTTPSFRGFNCSAEVELHGCNICTYTANFQTSIFEHLRLGHVLETCSQNGYNQVFTMAINSNVKEIKNNEKQHKCSQCGLITLSKVYLFKHVERCKRRLFKSAQSRQLDDRPWFKCAVCPFKTKTKTTLVLHGKYKHLPDHQAEWFKCEYCSFKTKYKHSLRNHKVTRHKSSKRELQEYVCTHCPFTTLVKDQLGKHIKRKHVPDDEAKWFECGMCSHRTRRSDVSKRHRLICYNKHLGDISFNNKPLWT